MVVSRYECEVKCVSQRQDGQLDITLTNEDVITTDVLVSATGVTPNTSLFSSSLSLSPDDGGILVDRQMATSQCDVYAAGDCCTIPWKEADTWKQMRLWTQARHQG